MRRVVAFTFMAYAASWSYWGWMIATGQRVVPGSAASHLPGLIGPALAGSVTIALFEGRAGVARLARLCVTIPRARLFAGVAILLPPLLALIVLAFTARPFPSMAAFLGYPGMPAGTAALSALALIVVLNGYGEEIGWRGVLLPALLRRMGRLPATLIMALIWAGWHLPLFIVNSSMAALVGPALIGWLIGLVLGAFVLAHLWQITGGSLLAVALWHSFYNLSVATLATQGPTAAVVSTMVMVWGLAIAWTWRRG